MKGADGVAADTYKTVLLKDWDVIRENVKKGLKRLGHDILIVPVYDTPEREEKKGVNGDAYGKGLADIVKICLKP